MATLAEQYVMNAASQAEYLACKTYVQAWAATMLQLGWIYQVTYFDNQMRITILRTAPWNVPVTP